MLIHKLNKNWVWLAAMLIVPVGAMAASGECRSTPKVKNASVLMGELADHAVDAWSQADELQTGEADQQMTAQSHAYVLSALTENIDAMGAVLCQLDQVKDSLPASQRKEIEAVRPTLAYMANHATYAIEFLRKSPDDLWSPSYAAWVKNLDTESHQLVKIVGEYSQYAKVHHKDLKLEQATGMAAGN